MPLETAGEGFQSHSEGLTHQVYGSHQGVDGIPESRHRYVRVEA